MSDVAKDAADLNDMILEDARSPFDGLDDDHLSALLLPSLNSEYQLATIRRMLHRNKQEEKALEKEMEDLGRSARSGCQQSADEWGNQFYNSIYLGAAHSMAAVGMLAPLTEAIFQHAFHELRRRSRPDELPSSHARWGLPLTDSQWDCHFTCANGERAENTNVIEGILQLSEATDLLPHLPSDFPQVLRASSSTETRCFIAGSSGLSKTAKSSRNESRSGQSIGSARQKRWQSMDLLSHR